MHMKYDRNSESEDNKSGRAKFLKQNNQDFLVQRNIAYCKHTIKIPMESMQVDAPHPTA